MRARLETRRFLTILLLFFFCFYTSFAIAYQAFLPAEQDTNIAGRSEKHADDGELSWVFAELQNVTDMTDISV